MYYKARKEKKETPPFAIAVFSATGLVAGFILFSLLFVTVRVQENSMEPSVKKGAVVLVFKPYKGKQSSIVLLKHPFQNNALMIRRIAAIENDTIEIIDKNIIVNSRPWNEGMPTFTDQRIFPTQFTARDNMTKIAIPSKFCFVVGDNRDASFDSRTFGPVQIKSITGTVIFQFKK